MVALERVSSQSASSQLSPVRELWPPARATFAYTVRLSLQFLAVLHLLIGALSVWIKKNRYTSVRHRTPLIPRFRLFHPMHFGSPSVGAL
jgi:hypothetical protein